jgi:hypothetical protein
VRAQCKQSEIVWREHTHDVTYHLPDIFKNRSGVQKDISINISVTVEVKKIVVIIEKKCSPVAVFYSLQVLYVFDDVSNSLYTM